MATDTMKTTWANLSARLGRNDLPEILAEAVINDSLSHSELAIGVADAWTSAEWPARLLDSSAWGLIFNKVLDQNQYLLDDGVIDTQDSLPKELTLWRGAYPEFRLGMSWTSDRERAEWFAHRLDYAEHVGVLYQATIPSEIVFARFERRGEAEYVIDLYDFFEDDIEDVQ